jgi:hypothetical protein
MNDQELQDHLRDRAQRIVERLESPDLRAHYQNTLVSAFRQEKTRRQMVPWEAITQQPELAQRQTEQAGRVPRRVAEVDDLRPPSSLLLPDRDFDVAAPEGGENRLGGARLRESILSIPADIDQVLSSPVKYGGKRVLLSGLFKIGTKISEVKGSKGQTVGQSIPVARVDDRTICTGDRKIDGYELYLILDENVAQSLRQVFEALELRPMIKPTLRSILEVSVRRLPVQDKPPYAVAITSLEILGMCDYLRIARHDYVEAFRVAEVKAAGGQMLFGDGDKWAERLGGDEKFVQVIRRKLREFQRRRATDIRQAQADTFYQGELSKAMQAANSYQSIRAMELENWRRLLVNRRGLP